MIFAFLYPLSIIPLKILYFISDFLYYLLYYVIRYRRKTVSINIKNAFSFLSNEERKKLEKEFYVILCDSLVESLKLLSISKRELQKHITVDYSELEKSISQNKNCHIYLGHQLNWEWANAHISSTLKANVVVAYKPIKNKQFNILVKRIRSRFGSKLVSSKNMKKEINDLNLNPHILILVADQNPKVPLRSFWTTFLSQKTAFLSGTEMYSSLNKAKCFFAHIKREKRGHYKFVITPLFDFSEPYKVGLITYLFAKNLENSIIKNPENYLWSHRRWKHIYKEEYKKRWI